jgi:Pyruvate/2-oxoacid:ferredoxin oxidoreductase gamma subunit
VTDGLREDGGIVINAPDAGLLESVQEGWRLAWVDATAIAARHGIGTATSPIVNTTMVGAFAGASGLLRPEHVEAAMREVMGDAAPRNTEAALEAYREVRMLPSPVSGALQALFEGGER